MNENDELLNRAERLAIDFGHRGNADAAQIVRDLMAENERLTARLRELASAEPVAYVDAGENALEWRATEWHNIPLIRRPEMP